MKSAATGPVKMSKQLSNYHLSVITICVLTLACIQPLIFDIRLSPRAKNAVSTVRRTAIDLLSRQVAINTIRDRHGCEQPNTKVHIVSADPMILYLENWITPLERQELVKLAAPNYNKSMVFTEDGGAFESIERTSTSAFFAGTDHAVKCLVNRASSLQGFYPSQLIWDVQATRYKQGQKYDAHWDWGYIEGSDDMRVSTIFGILEASCTSNVCGTEFPELSSADLVLREEWCQFIDCSSESLVFRAVEGNAVFWTNLKSDGSGDERTLHAGMPVDIGHKIGVNIWSNLAPSPHEAPYEAEVQEVIE